MKKRLSWLVEGTFPVTVTMAMMMVSLIRMSQGDSRWFWGLLFGVSFAGFPHFLNKLIKQ